MKSIAVIIGSLRKDSYNKKIMYALDKLKHPNIIFNILELSDIPVFNQDHEMQLPASVSRFKHEVRNSDGVLFITPEYNRSIPGMLKNVIDWGTRPYGDNVWNNKPVAMLGTSPGVIGTAVAQSHLRSIMVSVGGVVLGQPEVYLVYKNDIIDDDNQFTNADTAKFLQSFLDKLNTWMGTSYP